MTKVLHAVPEATPDTGARVNEVVATFRKWLHLPDPGALLTVLGTVAANMLDGDPVWLLVVGPPGGGKSEILNGVGGLKSVHAAATLTEPALLSGTPDKEKSPGAKGGLLREIGDFGIVLAKDFGSVLNMHHDQRAAVLAALREVYDGSWTRHVGTNGGKTLSWTGKVGLVAGCTPTIDRHHAVMGAMGERFVLFRLPEVDADEHARWALKHAGREREMRAELSTAVVGLLGSSLPQPNPRSPAEQEREALIALATLVVRCRSSVERDSYSREVELIPDSEAPTRLVVTLDRLLAGLDAIGVDRTEAWRVLVKVALDSMPRLRRQVLDVLVQADEQLETGEVAVSLGYPTTTVRRVLEDLAAHGIAEFEKQGDGKAYVWKLGAWASARYGKIRRLAERMGLS